MIVAEALHKHFGALAAVRAVSFQVRPGEALGLVGPDGAGKTTTLRLLVGALRPDAGTVHVNGHDMARAPDVARANIGYLAQRFSLYGDLTVQENLRFFGEVRGLPAAAVTARSAELLRFVGLTGFEKRRAEALSGGMKQKLGLACALIHRPGVLLLDEPTGGVDPVTRQDFWQLLIRVLAEGTAVVVSTPYMDEAARCSRVGFMFGGQLLSLGAPRELVAPWHGRVLELAATPAHTARTIALADPAVDDVLAFGDRLHLRVNDAAGALARLPATLPAAGVTVRHLHPLTPSLEDAFIALLEQFKQEQERV